MVYRIPCECCKSTLVGPIQERIIEHDNISNSHSGLWNKVNFVNMKVIFAVMNTTEAVVKEGLKKIQAVHIPVQA